MVLILGTSLRSAPARPAQASGAITNAHRVYSHLLDPREHPDYDRRAVKPPTWETFKNRTQFTCLRGFGQTDGRLTGFAEELEKYTRTYELGDVIWPSYETLFAKNLGDLADELKRRDLYLFDIWGYVPGSGPGGYWQQFIPPTGALATLESKLGERWLGTDIGEQDGRYIGGYANQMTPASASRFEQYLNFQRHFERMSDDLGNRHAALVSLNFGHYLLKEGTYTLLGAETAQALPNNQVYYAFIRGAGRQYGVPWFGNASIFNRWGYKTYGSSGGTGGETHGPSKGTSLSLMKRLLYSHILYNCVAVGFENGWFDGDQLSPIGRIQQAAQRWVKDNGQPGVLHTPVALFLDFYSGWSFPRHLYSSDIYRVWGNRPYEAGDYFTDAVLDLLYPGYQDSSYFHDESGFLAPTPYGDIADCLLSDAPPWLLARYSLVIVAGELTPSREALEKLLKYAADGGHLVITAGNLAKLNPGNPPAGPFEFKDRREMFVGGQRIEEGPLQLYRLVPSPEDQVLARYGDQPAAVRKKYFKGTITTLASPFGVTMSPAAGAIRSEVDKPLPKPYVMPNYVRLILEDLLRAQQLFDAGTNLSLITCRRGPGEYTVGIANNTWRAQAFRLDSFCGRIESLRELPLDHSEAGAVGQTPEGVEAANLGTNTASTIAGGDVRIFAVKVQETGVEEIAHRPPPPRPRGRVLPLRRTTSIEEEILARPTFFQHFDGVCVDWTYLHERETAALQKESGWLKRQGLRLIVDLSSGVNLYPTLRLLDNLPTDYATSMAAVSNVLAKMQILGARDLILSLHRNPENNFSDEQSRAGFTATLKTLAGEAARRGVTLHLRVGPDKPPRTVAEGLAWVSRINAPNLKLAVSTAALEPQPPSSETVQRLKNSLGLWLVAASRKDVAGKLWDAHAPIDSPRGREGLANCLAVSPATPIVLGALYANQDEEYLDALALDRVLKRSYPPPSRRVPGVVVDYSPQSSGIFIGSSSLAVLTNGDYIASHDEFGPNSTEHSSAISRVFRSSDRGQSWKEVAKIDGQFWSTLFVHHGALYLLGTHKHHGNAIIRRSTDGGLTWTTPSRPDSGLLRGDGEYHCAPVPVLEHAGRLWRAMERRNPPRGWGVTYCAGMLSAPVDADLLNRANWTFSNFLPSNTNWVNGTFGGWLEGNAVLAPDGRVLDILRVDTMGYPEKAALVDISGDGTSATFDATTGFVDFPGGAKKFTIRHDAKTGLYWSLATVVPERSRGAAKPASVRNTLALVSSADLRDWNIRCYLLHHPDSSKHGFQYVDWLFDGDDIIALCRTAYDDDRGGARNFHDANYLTFHRWKDFRALSMAESVPLAAP